MKRLVANQETLKLFKESAPSLSWGWELSKRIEVFANKIKDTTGDTIEQYNPEPDALIRHLTTLFSEADEIATEIKQVLDNATRLKNG